MVLLLKQMSVDVFVEEFLFCLDYPSYSPAGTLTKPSFGGVVGLICPLAFSTVSLVVTYSVHPNNEFSFKYMDDL